MAIGTRGTMFLCCDYRRGCWIMDIIRSFQQETHPRNPRDGACKPRRMSCHRCARDRAFLPLSPSPCAHHAMHRRAATLQWVWDVGWAGICYWAAYGCSQDVIWTAPRRCMHGTVQQRWLGPHAFNSMQCTAGMQLQVGSVRSTCNSRQGGMH